MSLPINTQLHALYFDASQLMSHQIETPKAIFSESIAEIEQKMKKIASDCSHLDSSDLPIYLSLLDIVNYLSYINLLQGSDGLLECQTLTMHRYEIQHILKGPPPITVIVETAPGESSSLHSEELTLREATKSQLNKQANRIFETRTRFFVAATS